MVRITTMAASVRRRRTEMGRNMKRNILAVFSLCCLGLFTAESQAFLGLWNHHHKYTTQITCRPYNAFTPICWGNLVCDGCCPSPCGVANGCLPMGFGVPPFACMGGGFNPYMAGGCAPMQPAYSYASDRPMNAPMTTPPPMPDPRAPFNPPMPMPQGPNPNVSMYSPYGVAQANYYVPYGVQYYPNYYMPGYYMPNYYQPMPYYWYGYGR